MMNRWWNILFTLFCVLSVESFSEERTAAPLPAGTIFKILKNSITVPIGDRPAMLVNDTSKVKCALLTKSSIGDIEFTKGILKRSGRLSFSFHSEEVKRTTPGRKKGGGSGYVTEVSVKHHVSGDDFEHTVFYHTLVDRYLFNYEFGGAFSGLGGQTSGTSSAAEKNSTAMFELQPESTNQDTVIMECIKVVQEGGRGFDLPVYVAPKLTELEALFEITVPKLSGNRIGDTGVAKATGSSETTKALAPPVLNARPENLQIIREKASKAEIAEFLLKVPSDAKIWVGGLLTQQVGPERLFETPALPENKNNEFQYIITLVSSKGSLKVPINFKRGEKLTIDFQKTFSGESKSQ